MGASTVEAVSVAHLEKPPKINDENIRRRCNVDFFIAAKHLKCQAQSSFILKMGWIHENSLHTKSRKTKNRISLKASVKIMSVVKFFSKKLAVDLMSLY